MSQTDNKAIISACLSAAANGPFFPDWEFHTLFGLTRTEVRAVAQSWAKDNGETEIVRTAINGSFSNLLGYPHRQDAEWSKWIPVSRDELEQIYQLWKRKRKHTNHKYAALIRARLAEEVGQDVHIRPIPSFTDSIVYEGVGQEQSVIFKMIDPNGIDRQNIPAEVWANQQALAAGVPASRVLVLDESCEQLPAAYMILEKARGVDLRSAELSDEQIKPYLLEIGRIMRLLHSVPVGGFGFLTAQPDSSVRGEFDSWEVAAMAAVDEGLAKLAGNEWFSAELIPITQQIIEQNRHLLRTVEQGRLLHGDLGMVHFFADLDQQAITAVIDFGECKSGDPVWDFVDFSHWRRINTILSGYGIAPDDKDFNDRFYLYAILRNLIWTVRWNDIFPRGAAEKMEFVIGEAAKHFGLKLPTGLRQQLAT